MSMYGKGTHVPLKNTPGGSRTKQSFKDQVDINKIVARYLKTGLLSNVNNSPQMYGDFSNVPDLRTALNTVARAKSVFMALPAKVRERFQNDPVKMVEFISDPKNKDEGIALGMFKDDRPSKPEPLAAGMPAAGAPPTP